MAYPHVFFPLQLNTQNCHDIDHASTSPESSVVLCPEKVLINGLVHGHKTALTFLDTISTLCVSYGALEGRKATCGRSTGTSMSLMTKLCLNHFVNSLCFC